MNTVPRFYSLRKAVLVTAVPVAALLFAALLASPAAAADVCKFFGQPSFFCPTTATHDVCGNAPNFYCFSDGGDAYADICSGATPDPRYKFNCASCTCKCDTANYPCAGCQATSVAPGAACSPPVNGQYASGCPESCGCPSGWQLCNSDSTCRQVVACPPGMTFNACSGQCETPYILRSPAIAQASAYINIDGGIQAGGSLTVTDEANIGGDLYLNSGRAIQVPDATGVSELNIGNYANPAADDVLVSVDGWLGIGRYAPEYMLDVSGGGNQAIIRLTDDNAADNLWAGLALWDGADEKWYLGKAGTTGFGYADDFILKRFGSEASPEMTVDAATGAITFNNELTVNGAVAINDQTTLGGDLILQSGRLLSLGANAVDPGAAADGSMYYNSGDGKFRCRQDGAWTDCVSALSGGAGGGGSGDAGQATFWVNSTTLGGDAKFLWNNVSKTLTADNIVAKVGFKLEPGAGAGKYLQSDASGVGAWQTLTGLLPSGATSGQTLRHDGTNWVANSVIFNNGTNVGIGDLNPVALLTVGDGDLFQVNSAGDVILAKFGDKSIDVQDFGEATLSIRNTQNEIFPDAAIQVKIPIGRVYPSQGIGVGTPFIDETVSYNGWPIDVRTGPGVGSDLNTAVVNLSDSNGIRWTGLRLARTDGNDLNKERWFAGLNDANADLRFARNGDTINPPSLILNYASGNVGIGTDSPVGKLEVAGIMKLSGGLNADPPVALAGSMYYNNAANKFRCAEGAVWKDCVAAGSLTGGGVAGRAAFWDSASSLSGDAGFAWDNTAKKLSVSKLQVGTSTTAGYVLTADAGGNASWSAAGGVGGSGTANRIPKFSAATNLADSSIADDGTNVTINTNKFTVVESTGNTSVAGTFGAAGDFKVNTNKFVVTAASGNTSLAGTLGVTGAGTFSSTLGAAGDFAVNTNKFVVTAATGNTSVAGTLGVTGAAAFSGRVNLAAHANNVGLQLPTFTGTPGAVTGTANGDIVWDTTNKKLYVYDGATFKDVSSASVGGSGASGRVSYWIGDTLLGGEAGFEYDAAADKLKVVNLMVTGGSPEAGKILTADASGNATWGAAPGGVPGGTTKQTLRHDGTGWVANSVLTNDGTNVGIGTDSPGAKLQVKGGHFAVTSSTAAPLSAAGYRFLYKNDTGATRIGYNSSGSWSSDSMAPNSFVAGNDSITVSGATSAMLLGDYLSTAGSNAAIIGKGISSSSRLAFDLQGLAVGYNSDVPTLVVRAAEGVGKIGFVGIGVISPTAVLDVSNTSGSYMPPTSDSARIVKIGGYVNERSSGTHPMIAGLEVNPPTIVAGAATLTDAATVYITGATAGTVTGGNYGLLANGNARFNNNLDVRGAAVFNEDGADKDFRVEGDTDANLLFADASAGKVGIGTSAPTGKLDVKGNGDSSATLRLRGASSDLYGGRLSFGDAEYAYIEETTDDDLLIKANDIKIESTSNYLNIDADLFLNAGHHFGSISMTGPFSACSQPAGSQPNNRPYNMNESCTYSYQLINSDPYSTCFLTEAWVNDADADGEWAGCSVYESAIGDWYISASDDGSRSDEDNYCVAYCIHW